MKHLTSLIILAIIIALPTIMVSTSASHLEASSPPNIYVSPPAKSVQIGQEFTINIGIDNVTNLYGYEIWMNFDNNKLNASAIDYDGFLNELTDIWYQEVNDTGGYVALAVTSLKPAPAKTGGSPPPLATVHFTAIGLGNSILHLNKTILANSTAIAIPHTTVDGEVTCSSGPGHDVAVTNVASYKKVIFQGFTADFNVTVENRGGFSETFNVSLKASNAAAASNQTISNMPSGTSANITFTWDTTGFAKDNYTISAYAWPVPGETNTADNNLTGGRVVISMVGDLTGGSANPWDFVPDGVCDGSDLSIVAKCFGSWPAAQPPLTWNVNCDVNNDGVVDGSDLAIVAKRFGEGTP